MASNKPAPQTERDIRDHRLPLVVAPRTGTGSRLSGNAARRSDWSLGDTPHHALSRHPGFRFGLGGLTVFREIARHGPMRGSSMRRTMRCFPTAGAGGDARSARRRADGRTDRRRTARPRRDRLQHRLDHGAARRCASAFGCRSSAPCRRSSRPAPPRSTRRVSVLGTEATVAREYTRALIRDYAPGLRGDAGRLEAACRPTPKRSLPARRSSDAAIARRDRALLSRRRRAHRHGRARLHALSAAARPIAAARAVAGELHRSRAGDRAPGRRSARPGNRPGARPGTGARAIFTSGRAPHAVLAAVWHPRRQPACTDREAADEVRSTAAVNCTRCRLVPLRGATLRFSRGHQSGGMRHDHRRRNATAAPGISTAGTSLCSA